MRRDSLGGPIPEGGQCRTTGKKMWSTRSHAKKVARQVNPGEHMSAYSCPDCGWFHIGHLPEAVRTGNLDRADIGSRRGHA